MNEQTHLIDFIQFLGSNCIENIKRLIEEAIKEYAIIRLTKTLYKCSFYINLTISKIDESLKAKFKHFTYKELNHLLTLALDNSKHIYIKQIYAEELFHQIFHPSPCCFIKQKKITFKITVYYYKKHILSKIAIGIPIPENEL